MKIGDFNVGEVIKETDFGIYLNISEKEILLPKKYIPKDVKIGDKLKVFIYKDSEDRIIATTLEPKIIVDEFSFLKVKDVNRVGAFLDWGLEKDILVPYSEQRKRMRKNKEYIVMAYLDPETDRIVATEKFDKFMEKSNIELSEGEEVSILIYRYTNIGVEVIINNKYYGLVYKNNIYKELSIGDRMNAYIDKVREDNKVDVTLRKKGYGRIEDSKLKILKVIKENGGSIPLNDKSSPELIKSELEMSKGTFKKAIGGLYKEKVIDISDKGIKIRN